MPAHGTVRSPATGSHPRYRLDRGARRRGPRADPGRSRRLCGARAAGSRRGSQPGHWPRSRGRPPRQNSMRSTASQVARSGKRHDRRDPAQREALSREERARRRRGRSAGGRRASTRRKGARWRRGRRSRSPRRAAARARASASPGSQPAPKKYAVRACTRSTDASGSGSAAAPACTPGPPGGGQRPGRVRPAGRSGSTPMHRARRRSKKRQVEAVAAADVEHVAARPTAPRRAAPPRRRPSTSCAAFSCS